MSNAINMEGERLLRLREVKVKTGLGHSSIYKFMEEGRFPRPVQLAANTVRWKATEIDAWIAGLPQVNRAS